VTKFHCQRILGTPYLIPTKTFCGQAADVLVGYKNNEEQAWREK